MNKLKELRATRDAMLQKRGENISEQFLSGLKNVNADELQHYIDVLNKKIGSLGDDAKVKMKLPIDVEGTLSDEAIYDVKTIRSLIESVVSARNKKLNPEKVTTYAEAFKVAKENGKLPKKNLPPLRRTRKNSVKNSMKPPRRM